MEPPSSVPRASWEGKHDQFAAAQPSLDPWPSLHEQQPLWSHGDVHPLAYPRCQTLDRVSKVSSLFGGDTSLTELSGDARRSHFSLHGPRRYAIHLAGHSQSVRATYLAPPTEPSSPMTDAGLGIVTLVISGIAFLAAAHELDDRNPNSLMILAALCLGIFFGYLAYRAFIPNERARAKYAENQERWHRAFDRWNRAFACERCDLVYLPDERIYVPSHAAQALHFGD